MIGFVPEEFGFILRQDSEDRGRGYTRWWLDGSFTYLYKTDDLYSLWNEYNYENGVPDELIFEKELIMTTKKAFKIFSQYDNKINGNIRYAKEDSDVIEFKPTHPYVIDWTKVKTDKDLRTVIEEVFKGMDLRIKDVPAGLKDFVKEG